MKVQDHEGKGIKTGRLWDSIGDHYHPYVVYRYTEDRSGAGPAEIFKDYEGYLQADAASVFDRLYSSGKIIEVGCMMHARRKFYEARTSDPPRAHQALAWIQLLYDVEREAKEKHETAEYEAFVAARHALRGERSRPIFKQFHDWLVAEAPKVLPKSPIGEAIQYALNHWTALERPLEAGFLELDNGACERAFKPVALGRKNWLFVGSDKGGETAAVLMSLCTTCKNLGIDPQAYLRDVLDRISTHPAASDRGAVARPLAGAAPGGRNRQGLTTPTPRVRLCPRRARGDCVRRAHKRHRIRGSPNAFSDPASSRPWAALQGGRCNVGRGSSQRDAAHGLSCRRSPPPRVALVTCTAERVPRAAVIPGPVRAAGGSAHRATGGCQVRRTQGGGRRRGTDRGDGVPPADVRRTLDRGPCPAFARWPPRSGPWLARAPRSLQEGAPNIIPRPRSA